MGGIDWAEGSGASNGGTELMGRRLERRLPAELLDKFQITLSRFTPSDPEKVRVLWCHLPFYDPELAHLANGGWRRFHRIVFVSNWQAQANISQFNIPWSRCLVLPNAIEPLAVDDDRFAPVSPDRPIRLIYTSVPNRGLSILLAAFNRICRERDDVELDVFSSYKLYGWDDHDRLFQPLYDALRQNPRINYHGAVSNEQVRKALGEAHVFAYPSLRPETSCLCLIEGMSAGLACVHPNYGALYETAAGWTTMYQWHEDYRDHAAILYRSLMTVIRTLRAGNKEYLSSLAAQKAYADWFYSLDVRTAQWEAFLRGIVNLPLES